MPETVIPKSEDGVVVLTVCYGPGQILHSGPAGQVRDELIAGYKKVTAGLAEPRDCIVVMEAQVAGSSFVRGLFELWEHVTTVRHGRVVCANYPDDYIDSLLTLGLTELDGFSLASSKDEAFRKLKRPAVQKLAR
jgi:hypothetical protein